MLSLSLSTFCKNTSYPNWMDELLKTWLFLLQRNPKSKFNNYFCFENSSFSLLLHSQNIMFNLLWKKPKSWYFIDKKVFPYNAVWWEEQLKFLSIDKMRSLIGHTRQRADSYKLTFSQSLTKAKNLLNLNLNHQSVEVKLSTKSVGQT